MNAKEKAKLQARFKKSLVGEEIIAQIEGLDPVKGETAVRGTRLSEITAARQRTQDVKEGRWPPAGYDTNEDAAHDAKEEGFRKCR